jgi:hypothetical protein
VTAVDLADITEHTNGLEVVVRVSKTDKDSKGVTVPVLYGSRPSSARSAPSARGRSTWPSRASPQAGWSAPSTDTATWAGR